MDDVEFKAPTQAELDRGWELQLEEERQRRLRWEAGEITRRGVMTEEEAELRAEGEVRDPGEPPPLALSCPDCGLRFKYKNHGITKAHLARHRKLKHPEAVEAG